MKTPVIFIIFNRPDSTQKVFDAIRRAEPEKLLVIADGPRTNRDGEAEKCSITRGIIDQVDWKCKVINNFSEQNMGCAKRISSGLDWAFSIVEEAIILEDDCIPEPTFFSFCEELLERYRDDKRIASISGQNVQFGRKRTNYSYYFSCFNHCWGWATWRRAWQHFDFEITLWPEVRDQNFLVDILGEPHAVNYWSNVFQSLYEGTSRQDSWAQRWTLSCWLQNSLGILANENLITNIGSGPDSTHGMRRGGPYDRMLTRPLDLPLRHPPFI
ncbi:MAG: glycosyltransferase family 2 protein, partial [Cyanobacteria bacterium P01_A01_bin.17]